MIDFFLTLLVRSLLWLRYRVRVHGLAEIARRGRRGILFLPNHPALIDPVILLSRLYLPFRVRALADRRQIDRFLIRRLARRVGVLEIEDIAKAGVSSAAGVRQAVDRCVEALRRGENLLLYPAGRAQRSGLADLGATSAVQTILRELPEVRVVLIRTRGLWGSSFSWARGSSPDVAGAVLKAARSLLLSGVFFAPRREVRIELLEPDDLPRGAGRAAINRYLEGFYNDGAAGNTYVPYTIWQRGGVRRLPEPIPPRIEGDAEGVSRATRRIVREYLRELTGCDEFQQESRLAHDLGMDSLSKADLITWLQSEFGFAPGDVESLQTVGDVLLAASGEAVSAGPPTLEPVPAAWFARAAGLARPEHLAEMTIPQAFLTQARQWPDRVILADQSSGALTYRGLARAVMALRGQLASIPGEPLGIMLPASVAANVVYLAALFAGKTPAMVNWTLGRRNLQRCLDTAGVEQIVTARSLVAQIRRQGLELSDVGERFVYVEDLAARLRWWTKLGAWMAARLSWASLEQAAAAAPETAAILFTSGSETVPKAVPLTHRNILTNVWDLYECVELSDRDALLGIPPPFHSFGLTVSMVLPLSLGLRTVYYPNPTDAVALGKIIDAYNATLLVGTPTLLHGIVRSASAARLASLRLVVSGAERCPPRVHEAVARRCPLTEVLEGYGVTECSPVISVSREGEAQAGTIGRPLPSLAHAIVDPETNQRLETGAEGMLLVRGPSVFGGYLHYDGPAPFVQFEGRPWYRTGDLVREDETGVLRFCGRLGRFAKIGGEMISLPAIESALEPHYTGEQDEGAVLAVVAAPDADPAEIVLFAVKEIDRAEANRHIRDAGLSGLHNVRRVIHVAQLPRLGTGKCDYRALMQRLKGEP